MDVRLIKMLFDIENKVNFIYKNQVKQNYLQSMERISSLGLTDEYNEKVGSILERAINFGAEYILDELNTSNEDWTQTSFAQIVKQYSYYLKFAMEDESPVEYALTHVNFNLPTTVGNP